MRESTFVIKNEQSNKFRINLKIDPEITKFLFLFITFVTIFYFILTTFESSIPLFNQKSIAKTLFLILKRIGVNVILENNQIQFSEFSFIVVRQCTGIFELMGLFSCLLAYPVKLKKRLTGILVVIPLIYLLNMLRLLLLSFLGLYFYTMFDAIHKYVFQVTFVSLVLAIWIIWIDLVKNNEKQN